MDHFNTRCSLTFKKKCVKYPENSCKFHSCKMWITLRNKMKMICKLHVTTLMPAQAPSLQKTLLAFTILCNKKFEDLWWNMHDLWYQCILMYRPETFPLHSWIPLFLVAKIYPFSFIFSPFLAVLPIFHAVVQLLQAFSSHFPRFSLWGSFWSECNCARNGELLIVVKYKKKKICTSNIRGRQYRPVLTHRWEQKQITFMT